MYQPKSSSYPSYYQPYVERALGKDLIGQLHINQQNVIDFFEELPLKKHEYVYAIGKWTPKDILLHLINTERIFSYRVLKIVRGDGSGLTSFDQDLFVESANANKFDMSGLLSQYEAVRNATFNLFNAIGESQLELTGSVEGNLISAGSIGFIILGHEMHHLEVIRERYL